MDINTHLEQFANQLDHEDEIICANAVESLLTSNSLVKTAQYVGVIGYVLKQNRAMCNCIRKKRVASDSSMQEVILQCLKEYQDGQDYHDTNWTSKYAQVISENPKTFDTAHLNFLYNLGGEFSEHIDKVRHVAQILQNNKKENKLISQILSHAEQLGQILKKEANSSRPFKLAVVPQEKGKLRRFWDYLRGHGEKTDEQMMNEEIDQITTQLAEVANMTYEMKSAIRRLQRDSKHDEQTQYHPTGVDQQSREAGVYKTVSQGISPNDWYRSLRNIGKLQNFVGSSNIKNENIYNQVTQLGSQLEDSSKQVDTTLDNIRQTMFSLQKRGSMLSNITQAYPGHSRAIIKTYQQLSQAIDKLEQDPLNEESQRFAQVSANRLNEILDPNKLEDAEEYNTQFQEWIKGGPQTPQVTPAPGISGVQPDVSTSDIAPSTEVKISDIDGKAAKIADNIRRNIQDETEMAMASSVLSNINGAIINTEMAFMTPLINATIEHLRYPTGGVTTESPQVPTQEPTQSVEENDDFPEEGGFYRDDPGADYFGNKPMYASVQNCLVKIGNAIDQVEPELADIIDQYIEEQCHLLLPKLPEYGTVLKENAK